jgi:hypothetical protein
VGVNLVAVGADFVLVHPRGLSTLDLYVSGGILSLATDTIGALDAVPAAARDLVQPHAVTVIAEKVEEQLDYLAIYIQKPPT